MNIIKLYAATVIIMIMLSCSNNKQNDHPVKMSVKEYNSSGYRFMYTVEFEGCEYVITKNGYSGGVCHKGNCKNPIHNRK